MVCIKGAVALEGVSLSIYLMISSHLWSNRWLHWLIIRLPVSVLRLKCVCVKEDSEALQEVQ